MLNAPGKDGENLGRTAVEWRISDGLTDYCEAVAEMEAIAEQVARGDGPQTVWLVEHPPLFTAGTSADPLELVEPDRFPVYRSGRGGRYTYHGPGQRVAYVMLDLRRRHRDVRRFVHDLEEWIIRTLGHFQIRGERRDDRVGVWVARPEIGAGVEDKIAAIGIRIRHWVSFHGIAINVDPDLSHFSGIVPCGIREHGVTSLADLGITASMEDVDIALRAEFDAVFGPFSQQ